MSVNRLWTLGAAIVALGVVALGYFFGIQPQLAARSTAQDSLASVQSTNTQLQAKVAKLASDSKNQSQLQAQFDALNASLPNSASTSAFVTELNSAASAAQVTLSGITVASAQPYAAPLAPGTTAAASSSSTSSSSSSSTPAPTASPTPAAPTPKPTAQAGMPPFTSPSVNGNTMAVIPVTITANADYASVLNFVKALQNMQRYLLVTGISTTPQTGGSGGGAATTGGVTATITGSIFSITGAAAPSSATTGATGQ